MWAHDSRNIRRIIVVLHGASFGLLTKTTGTRHLCIQFLMLHFQLFPIQVCGISLAGASSSASTSKWGQVPLSMLKHSALSGMQYLMVIEENSMR